MYTKEQILNILSKNEKAVLRAIIAIDNRQTTTERIHRSTRERNGRGWSAFHASKGTEWAQRIRFNGKPLTRGEIAHARNVMKYYAGQLTKIANDRRADARAKNAEELSRTPSLDENGRVEM